jgi:hypothetical protein
MGENKEPAPEAITQKEREGIVESKQENTLADFKRRIAAHLDTAGHAWLEAMRVLEAAEKSPQPKGFLIPGRAV